MTGRLIPGDIRKENPMTDNRRSLPDTLPLLPVTDSVIFPRMVVPLMVKEDEYSRLIDDTLGKEKFLVVGLVMDPKKAQKDPPEVHRVGTAVQVIKMSKTEEGTVLVVQGVARVDIQGVVSEEPYVKVRVKGLREIPRKGQKVDAMMSTLLGLFQQLVELSPHLPDELIPLSRNVDHPGALADMLVSTLNLDRLKKQQILEILNVERRLEKIILFLGEELQLQ